jgi:hypothetical protein
MLVICHVGKVHQTVALAILGAAVQRTHEVKVATRFVEAVQTAARVALTRVRRVMTL